ncbi:FAD-binding domain-containing protein [Lindgomyces ingoldianus]|uniref:FAD-binding domain-containing protein n=1 Tax=Lindgomyces ingoldianus TaxID=673940 RepID=A0ACB6QQR3_9PLEO|nr:FAD-binding domain-containing protein [Lindgomyces ingoldianus]KAF2468440.1 FAD-binding domain-containing protein [Lindgomyces ingoldianus]
MVLASSKSTLPLSDTPQLTYDHSPSNISTLCNEVLKDHAIKHSSDPAECFLKSSTKHSPAGEHHTPTTVFYPTTTAEVSSIAKACHERNIAITSFGGGTSLGGALTATRGGVCIDFRNMDRILGVHDEDMDVVVQPNVGWVELNEWLEGKGLFFPPDPAPGAKIGGMISMGCSGTNAYRYGTMKDWVISLTLVLADGTVLKTRNRPRKSSAGYDLTSLIVGSEGTLALVTEAVLKVATLPVNLHVGLACFAELQTAVNVVGKVLKSGLQLEAIELADKPSIHAINQSGLGEEPLLEHPTLFLKFAGGQEIVRAQTQFVEELCKQHSAQSVEVSADKGRINVIWGARKCLGNALVAMKKSESDLFLHTDAAVPVSRMAKLVEESIRIVEGSGSGKRRGWFCANVGHVGDGNVHTAIICPKEDKDAAEQLLSQVQRLALELEGTITGEHGVGLKLRDLLVKEVGQEGVDMMRRIKIALDPKGILNPDKVVRLSANI